MRIPCYHKNTEVLHMGTLPPRAYFIPYESEDSAQTDDREKSAFFTSLCGDWKFCFFNSFEDVDACVFAADYDTRALPEYPVPSCFQLYDNGKYDSPLYSNLMYPFPTDPPHVPDKNPCALYIKEFEADEKMLMRDTVITFEGVSSCFYLYVNGEFVGYSQVSHSTSEFDITGHIVAGRNRVSVLVVKWCDGSYLEDQDFFRLSGIFREVYLLSRGKTRLNDVSIKQEYPSGLESAVLEIDCDICGTADIHYSLNSPSGETVCSGVSKAARFTLTVPHALLWSDETPYEYILKLCTGDEIIPFAIALREVLICDKTLFINGKKIKLRGINRHDSSAENGYAVTLCEMKRDLLLMKKANCNCIRTSHYPNDPRFLGLAQSLGFYIVDEADLETHGMGYNTEADWDWTRWSYLSDSPEWKNAYVDRAARLYERDKNRGCVIMWSLGNESGCGVNHRYMREYIKSRDEHALVHYENAHLEFKAVPEGENFSDISDVESRMYPGTGYIEKYLNNSEYTKPFFMCEYVCSMSTGDVYDYWRLADKYDGFCGGCIWEWCDHAVNFPEGDGTPRYYYGGDFGDFPNNGICCIDGLVFPDRTPRPGYYDMKKVYEPFRGEYNSGVLKIKSVRYFTPLSDLCAVWTVSCEGKVLLSGIIEALDIAPQGEQEYHLFEKELDSASDSFLTVSVKQRNDEPWAERGCEAGFLQFELPSKATLEPKKSFPLVSEDGERYVSIACGDNSYVFDKAYGQLCSVEHSGKKLFAAPSQFSLWHAPTYNGGSAQVWRASHLDHVSQKTYSARVTEGDGEEVIITTDIALGGPSSPPVVKMSAVYTFRSDSSCEIALSGSVRENVTPLPRLGLLFTLKPENEDIRYFGLGETETYPDRFNAARYGEYRLTVTDNFVHYIRPQENSSHYKTRSVSVGKKGGCALSVTGGENGEFSFNASHYSDMLITETKHDFELRAEPFTYLHIDGRFNAISENREQNNSENRRIFDDKKFSFTFRLMPEDFPQ